MNNCENDLDKKIEAMNILSDFCALQDVVKLDLETLEEPADALVLFGGSPLQGVREAAKAMKEKAAKKLIVVGGQGHTTDTLRRQVRLHYPGIETKDRSEAQMMGDILNTYFGVRPDFLETRSTNCGNNITFLLDLLEPVDPKMQRLIFIQDASMQRRMDATVRKQDPSREIINYPAYRVHFQKKEEGIGWDKTIEGMWSPEHYLSLLMGEIQRLTDTPQGYGPLGKGFIVHVDIPDAVRNAFSFLSGQEPTLVRKAQERFASPQS